MGKIIGEREFRGKDLELGVGYVKFEMFMLSGDVK